jgi:predicted component of type VI protein secretion system
MTTGSGQRVHTIFKVKCPDRTRLIVLDTQDLSLGRSPENDLAIDESEMSRQHAVFKRTAEGCRVDDMGTSNGTSVNGECVDHADLRHGDVIQIGEVEITFAQTTRNPASLGPSVEYASQLKSFGSPMAGRGHDGEATILGLMDTVGGDDAFEVESAGDFDLELNAESSPGTRTRNLDEEIANLEPDPIGDFEFGDGGSPTLAPASGTEPEPDPVWELDEADVSPAERAPVATSPPPPKTAPRAKRRRIALTLEIEGAEGELAAILRSLAGKVLEVPRLRVKVKSEDLG